MLILISVIIVTITRKNTNSDDNIISQEPVRYLFDVFSIGFVFAFNVSTTVYPSFSYIVNNKTVVKQMDPVVTKINGLTNIIFSPLYDQFAKNQPTTIKLMLKTTSNKIVFKKKITPLLFSYFSTNPEYLQNKLNLTFLLASCFKLKNNIDNIPIDTRTYIKFNEVCAEKNPLMILSTGDIVYIEGLETTSTAAVQSKYDTTKQFKGLQNTWSNHTWLCCNDDHELAIKDGGSNGYNINMLRTTFNNNFPLTSPIEPIETDFRAGMSIVKNISYIVLDDTSCRVYNPDNNSNDNIYSTILGEDQIQFYLNALSTAYLSNGQNALIFVMEGKSMFGSFENATFTSCKNDKDRIMEHIYSLGLRNVCFLCGDTHCSDVSEYILNAGTNQIVRELRISSISSPSLFRFS